MDRDHVNQGRGEGPTLPSTSQPHTEAPAPRPSLDVIEEQYKTVVVMMEDYIKERRYVTKKLRGGKKVRFRLPAEEHTATPPPTRETAIPMYQVSHAPEEQPTAGTAIAQTSQQVATTAHLPSPNIPPTVVPPVGGVERIETTAVEKQRDKPATHKEVETHNLEDVFRDLASSSEGLSSAEAAERLRRYGRNELEEKKVNPILHFLQFLWNPFSWAMEIAAILSIILQDYLDFGLILALLIINACLSFFEERSAGNAVAALKQQLSATARVKRDGNLVTIDAQELVPGDVIKLKYGDMVPADCTIIEGDDPPPKLDQSALTGESIAVERRIGQEIYSGSAVKEGEFTAVVHGTGMSTYFGRTAALVQTKDEESHFQKLLTMIGIFCISYILIWVAAELAVQFGGRDKPCPSVNSCYTLDNVLVLIVGGIPIAMPTVLSVTMALGAAALAKKSAVVTRLTAVEELASMRVLCCDKTGTLTLNELQADEPWVAPSSGGLAPNDVLFYAALAARTTGSLDPIDAAVLAACEKRLNLTAEQLTAQYELIHFTPFNPQDKRTEAVLRRHADNHRIRAAKGAPQTILGLTVEAQNEDVRRQYAAMIEEFGHRGLRTLAVAFYDDGVDGDSGVVPAGAPWRLAGLIPILDPPRHDTAETIQKILGMGVKIKMITGDQIAIAKETARRIGIGTRIFTRRFLMGDRGDRRQSIAAESEDERQFLNYDEDTLITIADGFAQVFPEQKYHIVEVLQHHGDIVGMTGDGVNDAPALKRADIGIAVAGATDAARAAADIVLVSPGLGVIYDALRGSRKIFQRMYSYTTYSISVTVRIVTLFGILTIAFDFYFPIIAIVILAILNDGTIIAISKDRVTPRRTPEVWKLVEVFGLAMVLGLYLMASTLVLFVIVKFTGFFDDAIGLKTLNDNELRALIYLQVSVSGSATIFVTRTPGWSWKSRPALIVVAAFIISQTVATCIAIWGLNGYPNNGVSDFQGCGGWYALVAWIWSIVWSPLLDPLKFFVLWMSLRATKMTKELKGWLVRLRKWFSVHLHISQRIVPGHPFYANPPAIDVTDKIRRMSLVQPAVEGGERRPSLARTSPATPRQ